MNISEQELRAMVRDAVAKVAPAEPAPLRSAPSAIHASHGLIHVTSGGDDDGRCIIEPSVACTHCGYCQSLGH